MTNSIISMLLRSLNIIKVVLYRWIQDSCNYYTAKLSPQPHVREALGFLNTNPFPFRPSE